MTASKRRKTKKKIKRIASFFQNKTLIALIVLNLIAISVLIGLLIRRQREENAPIYYAEYVSAACAEFDVPQDVVYAVIRVESNFRTDADSSVGARGLMQITADTLCDINDRIESNYSFYDMYNAKINIRCGTFYLSYLYKRFGDWETVYAAYNAGPTKVSEWLKDSRYTQNGKLVNIPYQETENYVKKVSEYREEYINLYEEKLK